HVTDDTVGGELEDVAAFVTKNHNILRLVILQITHQSSAIRSSGKARQQFVLRDECSVAVHQQAESVRLAREQAVAPVVREIDYRQRATTDGNVADDG